MEGSSRVRKWVRRLGIRVGRIENQCAERRVSRRPLDGIPFGILALAAVLGREQLHCP